MPLWCYGMQIDVLYRWKPGFAKDLPQRTANMPQQPTTNGFYHCLFTFREFIYGQCDTITFNLSEPMISIGLSNIRK